MGCSLCYNAHMSVSQKLIEYAQAYLKKQPFDIIHDFEHHQLVVNNCQQIVIQEKLVPNEAVLFTSAWWHDVEKSYQTANSADTTVEFFKTTATQLGADSEFTELCTQTIIEHSFRQMQTTLESKILFDADKIEYVNDDRIATLVDDVIANPDRYQPDFLQETHDIWVARIKKVPDMMHFEYSRQLFLDKLKDTESILDKLQKAITD
jgi:HD superfamily phosphohydrolase YqeK